MPGDYINVHSVKIAANSIKPINNDISFVDMNNILDKEIKNDNKNVKWSKLLITEKIEKLNEYVNSLKKYNESQKKLLKQYIRLSINRKKLLKDKDVKYNINTGCIEEIYFLVYNENSKKFTLSNSKSKNTKSTIKNK